MPVAIDKATGSVELYQASLLLLLLTSPASATTGRTHLLPRVTRVLSDEVYEVGLLDTMQGRGWGVDGEEKGSKDLSYAPSLVVV